MSTFHCKYHDRLEDSDYVGFNVLDDDSEVCDDALDDLEYEDSQEIDFLDTGEEMTYPVQHFWSPSRRF